MQTTLRGWLPGAALGALFTAASPAAADAPSSLTWKAPQSCPSEETVLERLRRTGDDGTPRSPIDAGVSITQGDDGRWRGHVQIVADHTWTEREIEAALTCEAVVDAVVVILSVASAAHPAPQLSPQPLPPSVAPAACEACAHADEPRGSAGAPTLVITGNAQASFVGNGGTGVYVLFAPAVDLRLAPRLSLGAMFVYEHRTTVVPPAGDLITISSISASQPIVEDSESVGGGLRVGYDIPVRGQWSVWPTLSMALEQTSLATSASRFLTIAGDAFVPAMLEATSHLVFGVGPDMEILHEGGDVASVHVEFGVRLVLGGWTDFGGGPS